MQAPVGLVALDLAKARARKWLRIFQQLVRVLDRLESQPPTLLSSSLVFLLQRALGHLENGEPVAPLPAPGELELRGGDCTGDELHAAVDLARAGERRDPREELASDELEVLLLLAGSLPEAEDAGKFGDLTIPTARLVEEYRALRQLQPDAVLEVALFPTSFRRRWSALLKAAASKDDPVRRLALELSVMKVIHALYAMAVGYRRAASFDRPDPEADAWLAWSLGEATLRTLRRA
jgi:hypothetical protein